MIEIKLTFTNIAEAVSFLQLRETNPPIQRDTPSGTVRPKASTSAVEQKPSGSAIGESQPAGGKPVSEAPAEAPAQAQAAPPAEQKAKAKAPELSYKDVQAAVMALTAIGASDGDQGAGRVAAKKVCAGMNIGTFKEIQNSPALWQKAIEQLNAARVALQG